MTCPAKPRRTQASSREDERPRANLSNLEPAGCAFTCPTAWVLRPTLDLQNILDYERTAKGGARIVLHSGDPTSSDRELLVLEPLLISMPL